jgi:excisionase family DNA binding protein
VEVDNKILSHMKEVIQIEITILEFKNMITELIREEINNLKRVESTENEFLTRKQAAQFLSISLPTLHSYTRNGLIPAKRIGTRVLYSETDLQNALQDIPVKLSQR